jgi:hypothetical protein
MFEAGLSLTSLITEHPAKLLSMKSITQLVSPQFTLTQKAGSDLFVRQPMHDAVLPIFLRQPICDAVLPIRATLLVTLIFPSSGVLS